MRAAFAVAGLADALEHAARPSVHPRLARRLGFAAEYVSVRSCPSPEALADLVLASSCTPPFTPALAHGGRPALDGGIADNVPAAAVDADDGPTLVLLTRRYARLPRHPGRVYVQPSAPVAVSAWDYTDPAGIQAAFDLGRRDGEAFAGAAAIWREPGSRSRSVIRQTNSIEALPPVRKRSPRSAQTGRAKFGLSWPFAARERLNCRHTKEPGIRPADAQRHGAPGTPTRRR